MSKTTKLDKQLKKTTTLPIFIIIAMFILFLSSNIYFLGRTRQATAKNAYLTNYYSHIKDANAYGRQFIHTENSEDYELYKATYEQALLSLNSIKMNTDTQWRIDQLYTMTVNFDQVVNKTISASNSGFKDIYQMLNWTYDTIMESKNEYFTLLTSESSKLHNDLRFASNITFMLGFFICLIVLYILGRNSQKQARKIVEPIEAIVDNIKSVQMGTYDYHYIESNLEEIMFLADNVLEMSDAIQEKEKMEKENHHLMTLYLEEQNNNLRFQDMLSQSELKQMENTLNPHFLFNTLNIIYKTSLQEKAKQTSELLEITSQYLRYNLDYSENTSNLIHEVSAVRDYIEILKHRFGSKVQFELDIADDLPNIEIPGVIIQPIIENSIEYAFRETAGQGLISLSIDYNDDLISITVSDDGQGMAEESIDRIIMNDTSYFNRSSTLSLYNIMFRLKNHFQDKARFSINTCLDCGFEVSIDIQLGGLS